MTDEKQTKKNLEERLDRAERTVKYVQNGIKIGAIAGAIAVYINGYQTEEHSFYKDLIDFTRFVPVGALIGYIFSQALFGGKISKWQIQENTNITQNL